jgi:hypothetical protein
VVVVGKRVTDQLLVHIADVPERLLALTIYEVDEESNVLLKLLDVRALESITVGVCGIRSLLSVTVLLGLAGGFSSGSGSGFGLLALLTSALGLASRLRVTDCVGGHFGW